MAHDAEPALQPVATAELRVERDDRGYEVLDRGDRLAVVTTPRAVLDTVFARVHRRAFELAARRGWVRLHGVVLHLGDARAVVVGASGAGKTTLALAALAAGHDVEGDESLLVHAGEVVAVPRRLHVKPGSEVLVPAAAGWVAAAPCLDGDPPLRLVSPTAAGRPWRLRDGPVDHVVVLDRVDGGSSVEAASATEVAPFLVSQTFPTVERRAQVLAEVAGLLRSVGVHRLHAGPDGRALAELESVARPRVTG